MGTSSSLLGKNKKQEASSNVSNKKNDKSNLINDNENINNSKDDLMLLPKSILVMKIRNLEKQVGEMEKHPKHPVKILDNQENNSIIPRSIYSNIDQMNGETMRAKDVLIAQLERELRAQAKLFENQKLQGKKKIEKYAAEITELRFKSNEIISKLESELNCTSKGKQSFDRNSNPDHTSPLILKLSQKLNEQADIIKDLELSLCRKDEIIEGFRIFEANQYESENNLKKKERNQSKNSHISQNTHSFISKEMIALESDRRLKALSLSDECWFSQENLIPQSSSTWNENHKETSKKLSSHSCNHEGTKHLLGLPTEIISNRPNHPCSPQID